MPHILGSDCREIISAGSIFLNKNFIHAIVSFFLSFSFSNLASVPLFSHPMIPSFSCDLSLSIQPLTHISFLSFLGLELKIGKDRSGSSRLANDLSALGNALFPGSSIMQF